MEPSSPTAPQSDRPAADPAAKPRAYNLAATLKRMKAAEEEIDFNPFGLSGTLSTIYSYQVDGSGKVIKVKAV